MNICDQETLALFMENLARCRKQADHLRYSLARVDDVGALGQAERLERYEALTSRFARLQDMLLAPFKGIAHLELQPEKGERIPDLLSLMEKLSILDRAQDWLEIHKTRNAIAHEYWDDPSRVTELIATVRRQSEILIAALGKVEQYALRIGQPE